MASDVQVLRGPPRRSPAELREAVGRAAAELKVEKAWVFGSFGRGDADRWSDLDLLVVARTERPFVDRYRDYLPLFDLYAAVELLVYTPEEFAALAASHNPLVTRVMEEGALVYDRSGD